MEFFQRSVLGTLDDLTEELCAVFFESIAQTPEAIEVFNALTTDEFSKLRDQQCQFIGHVLNPMVSPSDLELDMSVIARAHSIIGIPALWLTKSLVVVQERLLSALLKASSCVGINENYFSLIRTRLDQFSLCLFDTESAYDLTLESTVSEIISAVDSAKMYSDAITATLTLLYGLDGIVSIAFTRPDLNGTFRYEFFEGRQFTLYNDGLNNGLIPVSIIKDSPGGNGPTGRMWRSRETQVCNSIANDESMSVWSSFLIKIGVRSSVAIPLALPNGELFAGIVVYSDWPRYFGSSRRLRVFEHVANVLSKALAKFNSGVVLSHDMRMDLISRLRSGYLEIYYQPIVSLTDFSIVKVEALARMRNLDGTMMSPIDFLPAFGSEELRFIFQKCLEFGLVALQKWDLGGVSCGLSVNIPPHGFADRRYVEVLIQELKTSGLSPSRITLELTEEEDLVDLKFDPMVVEEFRNIGVLLAQDDLGAGYSSLVRLEKFGFHEVKIDQALIRSASAPVNSLDLIQHLTSLSHDLKMSVVVEGLESDALIEAASILGADYGQGYGIARPMPEGDFLPWCSTFANQEVSNYPKTTFGALAMLRKWSRTLIALGGYIERIDPQDLINDLRTRLSRFVELDFELKMMEHYAVDKNSSTLSLIRFAEALFDDLVALGADGLISQDRGSDTRFAPPTLDLGIPALFTENPGVNHSRLHKLFELQSTIVSMLSKDALVQEVLDEICLGAQNLLPNSVATVMVRNEVDDLFLKASPSLSDDVASKFAMITPAPGTGSCANVMLSNEPVYVSNTYVDPRWSDLLEIARDLELCACWSHPVRNKSGAVVGTFALSSFEVRSPTTGDRQLLELCASLVGLVLSSIGHVEAFRTRGLRLERMFQDQGSRKIIYRASDGVIVDANEDAMEFLGYTRDEMQSMMISRLNENLTTRVLDSFIANSGENKAWHTFTYYRLANGGLCPVEVDSRFFSFDGEQFICATLSESSLVSRDVQVEREISSGILDSLSAMVVILDKFGNIARFNLQAEMITGLTAAEVIGVPNAWYQWVDTIDIERITVEIAQALFEHKSGSIDVWHIHKDGKRRLMEIRYMPLESGSDVSDECLALLCTDVTDRHHDAVQTQEQLDFISQVVEVLANMVFVIDNQGYVRQCNIAFTDFVGESFEQISSEPFYVMNFVVPEGTELIKKWFTDALGGNLQAHAVGAWINYKGERRVFEWSNVGIYDTFGRLNQLVIMGADITERRFKERQLEKASVVFENSSEAILFVDYHGTVTEVNPAFTLMTGFHRDDVVGTRARHVGGLEHAGELYDKMNIELMELGHWSGPLSTLRSDGSSFSSFVTISVIQSARKSDLQYVVQISDISELMKNQKQLSELAYYDQLTQLPNRTYITQKMVEQMAIARRTGRTMALVYLDLDNFKQINDSYGHDAGDELLREVAKRMSLALREVDSVARIGGDEFVCILTDIDKLSDCIDVLVRLENVLCESMTLDSSGAVKVETTTSMGVVFVQSTDLDPDQLLRRADMLMYEAKRDGGNRFVCEDFPAKSEVWTN